MKTILILTLVVTIGFITGFRLGMKIENNYWRNKYEQYKRR